MQVGPSLFALVPGPGTSLTGGGIGLDLSAGWVVAPDLVIALGMTHAAGAVSDGDGTNPPQLNTVMLGFGPAAVYYLPRNFFVGAAAGGSAIWLRDLRNEDAEVVWSTDVGFSAKVEVGKEWWVSSNWGLGGSLRAHYFRAKEGAEAGPFPPVWTASGLSLLFSATYD
jgi:hypothetical protein